MAAYPLGSGKCSSCLTALLGAIGLGRLYRHGRRELLILTAGAFGLGFVAAVLRRYPYGTSCRVVQHLAPFYCLLTGLGVAVLIQRPQRHHPLQDRIAPEGEALPRGNASGRELKDATRGSNCRRRTLRRLINRGARHPRHTAYHQPMDAILY